MDIKRARVLDDKPDDDPEPGVEVVSENISVEVACEKIQQGEFCSPV